MQRAFDFLLAWASVCASKNQLHRNVIDPIVYNNIMQKKRILKGVESETHEDLEVFVCLTFGPWTR